MGDGRPGFGQFAQRPLSPACVSSPLIVLLLLSRLQTLVKQRFLKPSLGLGRKLVVSLCRGHAQPRHMQVRPVLQGLPGLLAVVQPGPGQFVAAVDHLCPPAGPPPPLIPRPLMVLCLVLFCHAPSIVLLVVPACVRAKAGRC